MFATRVSRRRGIGYAVLLAVSLLLLAFSGSPPLREVQRGFAFAMTPIQSVLTRATRRVLSVADAVTEIDQLRSENRRLQERNTSLEIEVQRLAEIRAQNEQLTRLLAVRSTLRYESVTAEVIGRQVTQYERVVTLDQGTDRGITPGDVVVGGGAAVVGRVIDVGANFSRVLLISDTRSTVIGLIESSRATGDVQGQLGGPLVMSNIASTDKVAVNDTVVTAGIDLGEGIRSPFPKGLVIGRVVDVRRDPNVVVQTAYVHPAAPLDRLEYVTVLTGYEGGLGPATPVPGATPGATLAPSAPPRPSLAPAP